MAQPDAQSGHIAVDVGAAAGAISCCPVCMEPPEWVAIGPCGHREVCVACAARMRFFQRDRRCCICRAFCPTVVVTKAGAGDATAAAFSRPPASGGAGQVGLYHWYHRGMEAYFDDREQYDAARKMCSQRTQPSSQHRARAPVQSSWVDLAGFVFVLASTTASMVVAGVYIAEDITKNWALRVAIVLVCAIVGAGGTYFVLYKNGAVPRICPDA
ncbi:hypothetical protein ACP4OV_023886 [Aristida adscensionis]